jgi:uncharacterized protein YjbJ (UPF0337 family)
MMERARARHTHHAHSGLRGGGMKGAISADMMSWTEIEGQWKTMAGQLKSQWTRLSDEDLKTIAGNRDHLVAKVQKRYRLEKPDADQQVTEWAAKVEAGAETGDKAEMKTPANGEKLARAEKIEPATSVVKHPVPDAVPATKSP